MRCPKCSVEIEKLQNVVSGVMEYMFTVNKDGKSVYEGLNFSGHTNEFLCPECDSLLFTDEESATEFLKGV